MPAARPGYIGESYDVLIREREHNAALRAFMAGDIRRTTEYWPTKKAVKEAEKRAIETEQPIYNRQHNGGNPNRKVDLRRPRKRAEADA